MGMGLGSSPQVGSGGASRDPATVTYIQRVEDDSGIVIDKDAVNSLIVLLKQQSLYSNLVMGITGKGGVRTRVVGEDTFIPKAYDISTKNNDALQNIDIHQPKLSSTGFVLSGNQNFTRPHANIDGMNFGLGNFTVLSWINYPTVGQPTYPGICAKGRYGFRAYTDIANAQMRANRAELTGSPDVPITPFDGFKMLSYVFWDSGGLKIDFYMNTELDGSVATSNANATTADDLFVGCLQDRHANSLSLGTLDNFMIFNTALTDTQIAAVFSGTKAIYGVA